MFLFVYGFVNGMPFFSHFKFVFECVGWPIISGLLFRGYYGFVVLSGNP